MKNIILLFLASIGLPLSLNAQCTPTAVSGYPSVGCVVTVSGPNAITVKFNPAGTFCANTDNVVIEVAAPGTTITSSGGSIGSVVIPAGTGTTGAGYLKLTGYFGAANNVQWTAGSQITIASFSFTTPSGAQTTVNASVTTYVETGIESKGPSCSSSITLSLNLLNFQAQTTGKSASLNWASDGEKNTDGFNIERSSDSKLFEKVGFVKSSGTTSGTYTFTDEVPMSGVNYYRLKMLNTDGSFTYSPVRSVTLGDSKTTGLSVSPNPAKEAVYVKLNAKEAKTMTLELVDIAGKVLLTEKKKVEIGFNQLSLNLSGYSAGMYFLKVDGVAHRVVISE
jgi:hypothetical protein